MQEASLRDELEEMVESCLREGTLAMKSRARGVNRRLEKAYKARREI
jgi:hypothetical protein